MSEQKEKLEKLINEMPNNQNQVKPHGANAVEKLRQTMNEKIKKLSDEN